MCNILNGGKHAGGDLKFQEFLIVPRGGIPFKEMLRIASEVYHTLGKILEKKFGVSSSSSISAPHTLVFAENRQ